MLLARVLHGMVRLGLPEVVLERLFLDLKEGRPSPELHYFLKTRKVTLPARVLHGTVRFGFPEVVLERWSYIHRLQSAAWCGEIWPSRKKGGL